MFNDVHCALEEVISKGQAAGQITRRFTSNELAAHLANAMRGALTLEKAGAPADYIKTVLETSFNLIKN
nr:hypothetical protein [uncultured Paenibacillus sp.]